MPGEFERAEEKCDGCARGARRVLASLSSARCGHSYLQAFIFISFIWKTLNFYIRHNKRGQRLDTMVTQSQLHGQSHDIPARATTGQWSRSFSRPGSCRHGMWADINCFRRTRSLAVRSPVIWQDLLDLKSQTDSRGQIMEAPQDVIMLCSCG